MSKFDGKVPFGDKLDGTYIRFNLEDLAELEDAFGDEFFNSIESGCARYSPKIIMKCLEIGLKKDSEAGNPTKVWSETDLNGLQEEGFTLTDAAEPILEAVSQSWLGKSYQDLLEEAEKAALQKKKEQHEAAIQAVTEVAGVAKEHDLPFDPEASLKTLLQLLSSPDSGLMKLGN